MQTDQSIKIASTRILTNHQENYYLLCYRKHTPFLVWTITPFQIFQIFFTSKLLIFAAHSVCKPSTHFKSYPKHKIQTQLSTLLRLCVCKSSWTIGIKSLSIIKDNWNSNHPGIQLFRSDKYKLWLDKKKIKDQALPRKFTGTNQRVGLIDCTNSSINQHEKDQYHQFWKSQRSHQPQSNKMWPNHSEPATPSLPSKGSHPMALPWPISSLSLKSSNFLFRLRK